MPSSDPSTRAKINPAEVDSRRTAAILSDLQELHRAIRSSVISITRETAGSDFREIVDECAGEPVFRLDRIAEQEIPAWANAFQSRYGSFTLVCEGLVDGGQRVFSGGSNSEDARIRLIMDPIDGTRQLMHGKRSAWILTGVAHDRGPETGLDDIFLALQMEIPTEKQQLSDMLWTVAGAPVQAVREDLQTGRQRPFTPTPSQSSSLDQQFASFVNFFGETKSAISALEEAFAEALSAAEGRAFWNFSDQHLSTGGQIYDLVTGHDVFVADLRTLANARQGTTSALTCRPYDLCTESLARAAGVVITSPDGNPVTAPLDVSTPVDWIGYANVGLHSKIAPVLKRVLLAQGWLKP